MASAFLLAANSVTAFAYFSLTYQLYDFINKAQRSSFLGPLGHSTDLKKRNLSFMVVALGTLFAAFILLCGLTHCFNIMSHVYPDFGEVVVAQNIVLGLCAAVSIATAMVGYRLFPTILELFSNFELNSEGNLQHIENYLVEIVELVKESIVLLSEDMRVQRSNEASKVLFGTPHLLGEKITEYVHPDDLKIFNAAVQQTLSNYSHTPVTVEYRIAHTPFEVPPPALFKQTRRSSSGGSTAKIYAAGPPSAEPGIALPVRSPHSSSTYSTRFGSASSSDRDDNTGTEGASDRTEYQWVESTICKGMRLIDDGEFEYDVKMVTRNIEDRRKQAHAQYENILRESQEQARINAAKLRYISCIAHDLKTPLQSFCFSLDLLQQTALQEEQRDLVQQANVAVDLMKLTISQTMDISKALSGGKIVPHCATVFLSSVIARVKVIINGYGKQVPIAFDISPSVCDAVITDEEWLWQMLLNLLTNACKYTDKGGITVNIKIDPTITLPIAENVATPVALLFEVADTGVGVQADKIGHIFDAFSQVQAGQVTGTGLGLFGVRTRAEGLHGTCGARHNTASPTGTGTVIWFAIPYQPDKRSVPRTRSDSNPLNLDELPGSRLASVSSQGSSSQATTESSKIAAVAATISANPIQERQLTAIVVDDTLTVRKLMEKLLLKLGFARVVCYENGSKGLDAMMAGQADIVFTDVQMPIMTGPEMTARFRRWEEEALQSGARTVRQVIVAVTANGTQVGEPGHFDQICLKPLSSSEIQRVVQYFM